MRSKSVVLAFCAVALVAAAAGTAVFVVRLARCAPGDHCLSSPSDVDLLQSIRSDALLAKAPPGATEPDEFLTTDCYSSGGWLGYVVWKTAASDEHLADFYRSAAADGWLESPTVPEPDRTLARFTRDADDVSATVYTSAPALGGDDGVLIAVHSETLSASCNSRE